MEQLLPLIFSALIVTGVAVYVILDGFDLGVGILFPFAPNTCSRDLMIASIAPVWDGNETWLILGGVILFAAFPPAYAIALTAFYLPVMVLLLALIFRGVAFEFRAKGGGGKFFWSAAFFGGSLLASLAQGILLGAVVQGVPIEGGRFAGSVFGWLSPFTVITGLGVTAGYALLGACWLNMKTEGDLQVWARRHMRFTLFAVMAAMGVVSLWTPLLRAEIAQRWFAIENFVMLWPIPLLTAVAAVLFYVNIADAREYRCFALTIVLFLLGLVGLIVSLWPNILPPHLSIWQAAAPSNSLIFLGVGLCVTLPMVFIYTVYAYRVFHGKVRSGDGYDSH